MMVQDGLKSESADGHKDSSELQSNTNIRNPQLSKAKALNQKSCAYDHLKSQTHSSYGVIVPFFSMIFVSSKTCSKKLVHTHTHTHTNGNRYPKSLR